MVKNFLVVLVLLASCVAGPAGDHGVTGMTGPEGPVGPAGPEGGTGTVSPSLILVFPAAVPAGTTTDVQVAAVGTDLSIVTTQDVDLGNCASDCTVTVTPRSKASAVLRITVPIGSTPRSCGTLSVKGLGLPNAIAVVP